MAGRVRIQTSHPFPALGRGERTKRIIIIRRRKGRANDGWRMCWRACGSCQELDQFFLSGGSTYVCTPYKSVVSHGRERLTGGNDPYYMTTLTGEGGSLRRGRKREKKKNSMRAWSDSCLFCSALCSVLFGHGRLDNTCYILRAYSRWSPLARILHTCTARAAVTWSSKWST